jgi:hypothetical protein
MNIPPNALWKVKYDDARGSLVMTDVLDPAKAGQFSGVLSHKTTKWSYEEEWRLLSNASETIRLKIPIRRVITGPETSNADKNRVANAVVRQGRARFAQMVPAPDRPNGMYLHDLLE